MLKVVADSNIFISALNFGGVADEILSLARQGVINLFVSLQILKEVEGVLIKKFHWAEERAEKAFKNINHFTEMVIPKEKVSMLKGGDEADNRILECALAAGADVIITGDKALLRLKNFRGIKIRSPREFLDKLS